MAKVRVEDIRNVAICGHGSSGKTTLVDKILVKTGTINAVPSVDDGTSICDFDAEEKAHKYTIEATVVNFQHGGKQFNLIDTPGYPDFIGQTIGALAGVDTAIIVVNAQSGLEVNTRRVFDEAGKVGLGRMILINKMDGDNINFPALLQSIQELWGNRCVLLNVPLGQGSGFRGVASTLHVPADTSGAIVDPQAIQDALIESIIEVDEAVMERYLEGQPHTDEELVRRRLNGVRVIGGERYSARENDGLRIGIVTLIEGHHEAAGRGYVAAVGKIRRSSQYFDGLTTDWLVIGVNRNGLKDQVLRIVGIHADPI